MMMIKFDEKIFKCLKTFQFQMFKKSAVEKISTQNIESKMPVENSTLK